MTTTMATTERVRAALAEAQAEEEFWHELYEDLTRLYPDEFVAVVNGRVVAHSPDRQTLMAAAPLRGRDPHRVWVRFVTRHPRQMLLAA
jgi:hypothetical protein